MTVAITAEAAFRVAFADAVLPQPATFDPAKLLASALKRACEAGTAAAGELVDAVNQDLAGVKQKAEVDGWTDETGVSQNPFGPMWPAGRPAGWPGDYVSAFRPRARLMLLHVTS